MLEDIEGGFVRIENLEKQKIILKIKTVSPDAREESSFYDLHGFAVRGTESIRIEAQGLDGLVLINIKLSRPGNFIEFTFSINFKLWDNFPLNAIQYFDKIYQLHYEIINNWKLDILAENKGIHLFSSCCDDCGIFFHQFAYLNFTRMARDVSEILKYSLVYNSSFEATGDDCSKLVVFYEVLTPGSYKFPFK